MIKYITVLAFFLASRLSSQTWVQTSLTDPIGCLAVNGTSLYAASNGIQMTTDFGITWTPMNTGLTTLAVTSIAIENTKMIAGTANGGVFLSLNGGASWNAINGGVLNTIPVTSVLISGSNMFAGTVTGAGDGIYMSSNNGTNWSKVNGGLGLNGNNIRSFGKAGSNLLTGTNGGGIYVSTNNGLNWNLSTLTGSSNGYFLSFANNGTKTYAGNGGEVLVSNDNGMTFSVTNSTLNCGFNGLVLNGNDLYAATQTCYGPYVSTNDGVTLTYFFNGLSNYDLSSIVICGSSLFIGSQTDGVWKFPISVVTNLKETETNSIVELFPNPSNDKFSVTLSEYYENVTLSIINVQGRIVKTISIYDKKKMVDVEDLSPGVYMISIKGKGLNETKRFLKL